MANDLAPAGATKPFCRTECVELDEPLLGTAAFGEQYVLITWPKSCWTYKALKSKRFPAEVAEWQAREQARTGQKPVVRLLSRPGLPLDRCRVVLWPQSLQFNDVEPSRLASLLDDVSAGDFASWAPEPAANVIAICTHGKHDRCCAKWGTSVFDATTKAVRERGLDWEVWEATHLGGHRFAATAIAWLQQFGPGGRMFGRLTADTAAGWIEALSQGVVPFPLYRGRVDFSAAMQLAEGCGVEWLAGRRGRVEQIKEGGPPGASELGNGSFCVVSAVDAGESVTLDVRTAEGQFRGLKSCQDGVEDYSRLIVESVSKR